MVELRARTEAVNEPCFEEDNSFVFTLCICIYIYYIYRHPARVFMRAARRSRRRQVVGQAMD